MQRRDTRLSSAPDKTIESFEVEYVTEDERTHTVMFSEDDYLRESAATPDIVFLDDFVTTFNAPTGSTALSIAEMYNDACNALAGAAAEHNLTYTLAPERYRLCLSMHGLTTYTPSDDVPRPRKDDGCAIINSTPDDGREQLLVRDWNRQHHTFIFEEGRLVDAITGYSLLDRNTMDALFAALRTAQAEIIAREGHLETEMGIEVYATGAVNRHNHPPF